MAITTAMATSFKVDLLDGTFSGFTAESPNNTHKLALFDGSATLDATTTAYSSTNEMAGTGGYTQGGSFLVLAQVPTSTSTTAWLDFADLVWATSTITSARGCMIYDTGNSNATISVHDFGGLKSSSSGDFTVVFPVGDSSTGIIRIA